MQRSKSTRRYKERTSWAKKCKDYIRNFVSFMFSNVGIIGLVIGYTIAGSFIFMAIESRDEESKASEMKLKRQQTVANLWKATCEINLFSEQDWRKRVEEELLTFQNTVVDAVQYGYEGEEDHKSRWSISGAFLYSLTVITTIGYGNIAPKTEWGKFATILYAIVGMPLFLLYLSNIGDILAKSFKWTYAKCCLCKGCSIKRPPDFDQSLPSNQDSELAEEVSEESESDTDPQSVTVPITLCLIIMVGYVYGGAILFAHWENWGQLDGAYFCFISLSTIGFGDFVPGDMLTMTNTIEFSFILCSTYLMLGMALIAMCFNLMQEEVVHKIRCFTDATRRITRCNR